MAELSLYLTNVNISLGKAMDAEKVRLCHNCNFRPVLMSLANKKRLCVVFVLASDLTLILPCSISN